MIHEKEVDLEKYLKYSTEELEILKEGTIEKINESTDNHWLNRVQRKTKYNLTNILRRISKYILIFGSISLSIFFVIFIINRNLVLLHMDLFMNLLIFGMFIPMTLAGFIVDSLDDGTRKHRMELRNIDLILKKRKLAPNKRIMLDSNIFDDFTTGKITRDNIRKAKALGYKFYITHIQTDEIADCGDNEKRKKLNLFMTDISPEVIKTESTVVGLSRFGFSKLNDGDKIIEPINESDLKKSKDKLIGEAAVSNKLVLLTNDQRFKNTVSTMGGAVISIDDFKKILI